jgi:SAM-dependent methyltransferase
MLTFLSAAIVVVFLSGGGTGVNLMVEPGGWRRRVEEFVLGEVGDPPARVLEVGCGEGELARTLARAGHSVTAIDPRAPEGPIFRSVGIEAFSDPGPFDRVVASLSLHHVGDLGGALDKIAALLREGGALIVVEFAWERLDGATAEWALERLPAASLSGRTSWLERRRQGWAEEGFHDSRRMRSELRRRFAERRFEWVPYLYADLADGVSEADERAAIEAGTIDAIGFRYVGTPLGDRVLDDHIHPSS